MPQAVPAAPIVSRDDLDAVRLALLRRRFRVFAAVVGALVLAFALLALLFIWRTPALHVGRPQRVALFANLLAAVLIMLVPYIRGRQIASQRLRELSVRTMVVVMLAVLAQFNGAAITASWLTQALRPIGFTGTLGPLVPLTVMFAVVHTAAALIVPWTVREALVPLIGVTLCVGLGMAISPESLNLKLLGMLLTLAAGVPGVLLCWLRHSHLRDWVAMNMLSDRYADMQRELAFARRIHERLFPRPRSDGPLRFAYHYEPMREIGGDYLDLVQSPAGVYTFLLIDVTGHGVASALAVNRLHGEIRRVCAEDPGARPGQILTALNRYVKLTLADERVFATALALRFDCPAQTLSFCSAGHPPALLIPAGGAPQQLDSTAALLGVLAPERYEVESIERPFRPGDTLVAYTDGAIECLDQSGRQLGIESFLDLTARAGRELRTPSEIAARLAEHVSGFRHGAPADDTLILVATARTP